MLNALKEYRRHVRINDTGFIDMFQYISLEQKRISTLVTMLIPKNWPILQPISCVYITFLWFITNSISHKRCIVVD